jgi:hypothetical protein
VHPHCLRLALLLPTCGASSLCPTLPKFTLCASRRGESTEFLLTQESCAVLRIGGLVVPSLRISSPATPSLLPPPM